MFPYFAHSTKLSASLRTLCLRFGSISLVPNIINLGIKVPLHSLVESNECCRHKMCTNRLNSPNLTFTSTRTKIKVGTTQVAPNHLSYGITLGPRAPRVGLHRGLRLSASLELVERRCKLSKMVHFFPQ